MINTIASVKTIHEEDIELELSMLQGRIQPFRQRRRAKEKTINEFLCNWCSGLPNWVNKPLTLKCGHEICANCLRMYLAEEFMDSMIKTVFRCPICLINQDLYLTSELIDYEKLR